MRVGIVSEIIPFVERLGTALEREKQGEYEILTFTEFRQACIAAENHQVDILLSDERLYKKAPQRVPCPLIVMVEKRAEERKEDHVSYFCRYKSVQEWDQILQEEYAKKRSVSQKSSAGKTVLFTSAAGGTGTTTAAVAFSLYCAQKHWKPAYLNFESVDSSSVFFHTEELYGMDECLASIRSNRFEFHALMQQTLVKDISGVRVIRPCRAQQDNLTITGEEIVEICSRVLQEPSVDLVILDVKPDTSLNIVLPLLTSERIVLVTNGEYIANRKTEEFLNLIPTITNMSPIEVQEKTLLLYNRYRQDSGQVLKEVSIGKLGGINLRKENQPEVVAEKLSKLEPMARLAEELYV